MQKFMGLRQAAEISGLTEYTLRIYCKQGKIRYNKSGVKYILRLDWLEEDVEKIARANVTQVIEQNNYGQLQKINA